MVDVKVRRAELLSYLEEEDEALEEIKKIIDQYGETNNSDIKYYIEKARKIQKEIKKSK
ncbi:hypothetical protein [Emcibacter sp.]|uniref:hypothetical protein n=1 Tax=Emcibacter sp. TaxID=1979954 RepID=UPI002AA5F158|nr:hypothetical protein [Emcibacter sp.]